MLKSSSMSGQQGSADLFSQVRGSSLYEEKPQPFGSGSALHWGVRPQPQYLFIYGKQALDGNILIDLFPMDSDAAPD